MLSRRDFLAGMGVLLSFPNIALAQEEAKMPDPLFKDLIGKTTREDVMSSFDIRAFYAHENLTFDQAIGQFYRFIREAKKISSAFSTIYFVADSMEESLSNPLPDEEKDFYRKIKEQAAVWELPGEKITYFGLGAPIEGCDSFVSIGFDYRIASNCRIELSFVRIGREGTARARPIFDALIASLIKHFPIQYILENCISDTAAWLALKLAIGWAITAATADIGRIQGFPRYEIAPGFTRLASVVEVFDVTNPKHVERAQALERAIEANTGFVKRSGFFNSRKNRK